MKHAWLIMLAFTVVTGFTLTTCKQPEIFKVHIKGIKPKTQSAGQQIRIYGDHLAFGTYVKIDTIRLSYDIEKDSALVTLPKDFPTGSYQLLIESVEGNSNEVPITILPAEIEISADAEVNVGESLIINGDNFVAPIQVILCSESVDTKTIEDASIKSENQLKVFIPVDVVFDEDSRTCTVEIISNSVGSSSIIVKFNNPKNPKLTTTNFINVFEKDIITIEGQHLAVDDLTVSIDGIPITDPVIIDPSSIQIIIPPNISESGKITIKTKYGEVEADYSKDDSSNRVPMIDDDIQSRVYSDDSVKIHGENFEKYPLKVWLTTNLDSKTLLNISTYKIVNDSFLMISLPENISEGDVELENEFGSSSPFHFEVFAPPIIQTSLPKSNPTNGPLYLYGQNLSFVSSIIFKSKNGGQETDFSNIVHYPRCFDPKKDTCDIITLNVPNITPGNYEIFASIKEGGQETKRSKVPLPFEILSNYNGNTLAGTGNTNIVMPNPPVGTIIGSVQNKWFILNNSEPYQLIEPETPAIDSVQSIFDDFNNLIGEYHKNASFVKIKLFGLNYQGQFDSSYYDIDDRFYVRKMVLIPEEQGNVVILLDKQAAIESLNRSQFHAGDEIIVYGRFEYESFEMVFQKPGSNDLNYIIENFTDTSLNLKLPTDIPPGTYNIYLDWGEFDFYSNRKTITIME